MFTNGYVNQILQSALFAGSRIVSQCLFLTIQEAPTTHEAAALAELMAKLNATTRKWATVQIQALCRKFMARVQSKVIKSATDRARNRERRKDDMRKRFGGLVCARRERVAVVIGVGMQADARVRRASMPQQECAELEVLLKALGYQVRCLTDATEDPMHRPTRDNILQALKAAKVLFPLSCVGFAYLKWASHFGSLFKISFFPGGKNFWFWVGGSARSPPPPPAWISPPPQ